MTADLYTQAGVNIDAGNKAVSMFKDDVASTHSKAVLTGLGSFGALYDLKEIITQYQEPVLVQSIDGVGTKLSIAKMMNKFDTVGEDIVNHSINDILVMGARAISFLDYVAHDKLDPKLMASIVAGMCKACRENNISLVGGETAEMPGTYQVGEHDIVGCISGVVEKSQIITGAKTKPGDILLGIESSGLHTNGYSLARKVLFDQAELSVNQTINELDQTKTLGEILLAPHRSYAKPVLEIIDAGMEIKALAHITGGGFIENIPRVLPSNCSVEIELGTWKVLPIYNLIQKLGNVPQEQMYRVFNMGIGLIIVIDPGLEQSVTKVLSKYSYKFSKIGKVVEGNKEVILK